MMTTWSSSSPMPVVARHTKSALMRPNRLSRLRRIAVIPWWADLAGPRRLRVLVKRRRRERGSEPGDALGASDHERHDRRGNGHTELVRGHPARRRDGRILRDTRRLHGERGLSDREPYSTATSCTDTNVPVGAHKYKVTAVWRSWTSTGVEQTVTVAYGPATHLVLEAASTSPVAGESRRPTITAKDASGRHGRHRLGYA